MRWLLLASAAALGCSAAAPAPQPAPKLPEAPPAPEARAPAPALGPTIDEAHARVVLNESFRNAGLRVLADVEVAVGGRAVTIDGFDPDKRIGFEYSASQELPVQAGLEKACEAETSARILVVDATDEATLRARAAAFLQRYAPETGTAP